jgi:hypothetical protein
MRMFGTLIHDYCLFCEPLVQEEQIIFVRTDIGPELIRVNSIKINELAQMRI